jgi:hypothetical protein
MARERRERDADGFEHACGAARRVGAQHEALGLLIDGHLLDPVEITDHVGPLWIETSGGEALVEFFAQNECEE